MLFSHIKKLCTILPALIAAAPHPQTPGSIQLPDALQKGVSECARECVQTVLLQKYTKASACPDTKDLKCLCGRYNDDGYSLGEVALGCVFSKCDSSGDKAAAAYNICFGQEGAAKPTQSVLKVSAGTSFQSKLMPSTAPAVTPIPTAQPTGSDSVFANSASLTGSRSSSPTNTATTVAAAQSQGEGSKAMKPAQIAGIAVAAAATFIVAIGLMALSIFLRRKRERKQLAEDKLGEKDSTHPPNAYPTRFSRFFETPGSNEGQGQQREFRYSSMSPPTIPQNTHSSWPAPPPNAGAFGTEAGSISHLDNRQTNTSSPVKLHALPAVPRNSNGRTSNTSLNRPLPKPHSTVAQSHSNSAASLPLSQIGVAMSSERERSRTRSMRRKSRLRDLRVSINSYKRPESTYTVDTVFEEDAVSTRRRSSMLLPTPPMPPPPVRQHQPATFKPPGLSLNIPVRHSKFQSEAFTLAEDPFGPGFSVINRAPSNATTIATDIPEYYFSPETPNQPDALGPPFTMKPKGSPKVGKTGPKASTSTVSRTRTPSRSSSNYRDSVASQTSFESIDDDDPTPEDDEDKQLSDARTLTPVAESPISNLRYPKIPRTSNQLVSRSPLTPKSSSSERSLRKAFEPSALLVKRRGQQEAITLEHNLQMDSPRRTEVRDYMAGYRRADLRNSKSLEDWNSRQMLGNSKRRQSEHWPASPTMYDRSDIQRPIEAALKSPAWIPNLTPTRHGDDLYLNVSYSKPANFF